jgi:hypothetical protein
LLIVTGIVMGFTLQRVYSSATNSLQQQYIREVELLARSIDNRFISLARIAEDTAIFLGLEPTIEEAELYALLRRNANRNPLIYGAAIAFEPFAYKRDQRLFAPYVYDTDLKAIDIGADSYDYTSAEWEWYSAVEASHSAKWTEPYFDTGAGNLAMTTYSAPIMRGTEFIGVTTVDLRLDSLSMEILDQLRGQKFMIMSADGRFVAHYKPEMALNSTLHELVADQSNPAFVPIADRIMGSTTSLDIIEDIVLYDEVIAGTTWIFSTPIPSAGWRLATLVSEDDVTSP